MTARLALLACAAAATLLATPARNAHAEIAYATTIQGALITFDTSAPGVNINAPFISGLQANEVIVGIDVRPANGQLIGVGSFGNLYNLDPLTGAATNAVVLTNSVGGAELELNGSNFGVDFNPTVDRLRVVSTADQNLRINVDSGVAIVDTSLTYPAFPAVNPNITQVAYANNFPTATSTTLYGIDSGTGNLVRFLSANGGTLEVIGSLGFGVNELGGFDISGLTGNAFAVQINATLSESRLYGINLATGAATDLGQVGGGPLITSFALAAIPEPSAVGLLVPAGLLLARRRK